MSETRKVFGYSLRAVLVAAIAGSAVCAPAQKQPELVVNYVSPSLLSPATSPDTALQTKASVPAEAWAHDERIVAIPRSSSADRWLDFEREYAIRERSPSRFLRMLQSGKYGLDKMAFTAQETVRKLEFTYDIGDPTPANPQSVPVRSAYSLPLFGKFGHAQVKSVLTEYDRQTGRPFVGLNLVIPFGKGASDGHGG